jgi:hypothetical protein
MEMSTSVPGEKSEVASFQADVVRALAFDQPVDLHLPAHETFNVDGDGNNDQESLSHDLVDASGVAESLVLYVDGTRTAPASVDYDANTVTIPDSGNDVTADVFYMAGDQAQVQVRIDAPRNHHEIVEERDIGILNLREQTRDPVTMEGSHPMEGIVPTDWRVRVLVDAPYEVAYENPNTGATADNYLLDIPTRVSEQRDIPLVQEARKRAIR